MPICEECGSDVQLISFDDFCADCEHVKKLFAKRDARKVLKKMIYVKDVFNALPSPQRTIMRHCDECVFAKMSKDEMELFCLQHHKPRFYQPKDGDFTSGKWGWRKKCEDFEYLKLVEDAMISQLIKDAEQ